MIVGLDFDNTIINYEKLFKKVAYKKKLVPKNIKSNKNSIKQYLISKKKRKRMDYSSGRSLWKVYYGCKNLHRSNKNTAVIVKK